jgi:outer membrane receptor protein involved in Fe transport
MIRVNHIKPVQTFLASLGAVIFTFSVCFGGITGKLTGKVTDRETGAAVPGVNILVIGTLRGATTEINGVYTIIGVPTGAYTIRVTAVGYSTVEVNDVKIGSDETTRLNFVISSKVVQLKAMVVEAHSSLVNSMSTASTQTISRKSVEGIPNVKSVDDVVKLQAGVVKQGKNLYLRGGRANEVEYLVDGVATNSILGNTGDLVSSAITNNQLQELYSSVQSGLINGGFSGLAVSASAIQTVSVQTTGFDADYGNAQSGIISIITKSGSDSYNGMASLRTDRAFRNQQNELYGSFSFGGPDPISHSLLPGLGVKLPGSITFFCSADMNRSDGPYQYAHNFMFNPIQRSVRMNGFLGGILNGLGYNYLDHQNNSFTLNSKIRYDISAKDQISYGYRVSLNSVHDYNRDYKYLADSSSVGSTVATQEVVFWQHFFTSSFSSLLRLHFSVLQIDDLDNVAGMDPPTYAPGALLLDVNADGFNDFGMDQRWYHAISRVWSLRGDYMMQAGIHLLKTGFEYNYEEVNSTEIQYPTYPHYSINGKSITLPDPDPAYSRGEWPGYGLYRWDMNNYPSRGAAYVQDNIEYSGLNLHAGLRYDFIDLGRQVYYPDWIKQWKDVYQWQSLPGTQPEPPWVSDIGMETITRPDGSSYTAPKGERDRTRFLWSLLHGNFSPRLSIGYPVTDRIVMYFNYGHFTQYPTRDQYFRDPFTSQAGTILGNPNLKPQRTIAYEFGFEDQLTNETAFTFHAFYKNIFDYATAVKRGEVYFYENLDYASARGFEVSADHELTRNFSINCNYAYQIAKGRSSNPLSSVFLPQYQLPRETRLDWDQNQTVNLYVTYQVKPDEDGHFLGFRFINNYGISLTWSFGSGFPYNGYNGGQTTARNVYLVNTETAPYTSTVDLSIYKGFNILNRLNLVVTLDCLNLFDRLNPTRDMINPYTGKIYSYGDVDPQTGMAYPWLTAEHDLLDASRFEAPRQVLLGLRVIWE